MQARSLTRLHRKLHAGSVSRMANHGNAGLLKTFERHVPALKFNTMSESPSPQPENQFSRSGDRHRSDRVGRLLQWIPRKARLAVCCGLLVLIPLALHSYLSNGRGDLNLICRHNLQSAELTVSIDGKLAFSESSAGTVKKRFGFLDKKVEGTLSKAVSLPLGKHTIRVNLKSSPERFDQTRQIAVNMVAGKESTVLITSQRGDLSLAYQGASVASNEVEAAVVPASVWSILITVAGSAASAAIGFMVQEFLRGRKESLLQGQSSKIVQ